MLKGWNRNVRISSAMISAWMMTRTVSVTPPSLRFSSLDTLIGLLVSHLSPWDGTVRRAAADHAPAPSASKPTGGFRTG